MTEESDLLTKLKRKRQHLGDWLESHATAEDVAGIVQESYDFTDWQIKTIEDRPAESAEIPFPSLINTLDSDLEHLESALPMIPVYDPELVLGSSALTSASTVEIFDFAGRIGDLGTEDASSYAGKIGMRFQHLQEKYDKPNEVRKLLERLANPNTLERFDTALSNYQAFGRGSIDKASVATSLRTLIDGVKGDLWGAARHQAKENMTWEVMASRLARGGPQGPQARELSQHQRRHAALVSRLSDVLKDREGGSLTNIDNIWSDVQGYLFTLLGLVDIDAIP